MHSEVEAAERDQRASHCNQEERPPERTQTREVSQDGLEQQHRDPSVAAGVAVLSRTAPLQLVDEVVFPEGPTVLEGVLGDRDEEDVERHEDEIDEAVELAVDDEVDEQEDGPNDKRLAEEFPDVEEDLGCITGWLLDTVDELDTIDKEGLTKETREDEGDKYC